MRTILSTLSLGIALSACAADGATSSSPDGELLGSFGATGGKTDDAPLWTLAAHDGGACAHRDGADGVTRVCFTEVAAGYVYATVELPSGATETLEYQSSEAGEPLSLTANLSDEGREVLLGLARDADASTKADEGDVVPSADTASAAECESRASWFKWTAGASATLYVGCAAAIALSLGTATLACGPAILASVVATGTTGVRAAQVCPLPSPTR